MTFDKLAYIDRLKAAGFAAKSDVAALRSEIDLLRVEVKSDLSTLRGEFRAELGGLKAELVGLRGELGGLRGELLAAMKADKIDFLKWVMMLIVGQTAVFTALKLLGH